MVDWSEYLMEDDGSVVAKGWNKSIYERIERQKQREKNPTPGNLSRMAAEEAAHDAVMKEVEGEGCGTELAKLISWFADKKKGCKCNDMRLKMNRWGPKRCRRNKTKIVKHLLSEAKVRNWPTGKLTEIATGFLVERAIKNYESGASGRAD